MSGSGLTIEKRKSVDVASWRVSSDKNYLDEAKFPSAVAQSRQYPPLISSNWTRHNSRQLWHNPGNIPTPPCSCVCRSLVGQRSTRDDTLYRSLAS
ncbi:hypothetical protein ACLKA6_005839 [Drosophila palustris]